MKILIVIFVGILLVLNNFVHSKDEDERTESIERKLNEINSIVSEKMLSKYNLFVKMLETEDVNEKDKLIEEFLQPIIDKNYFSDKRSGVQTRWGKRSHEFIKRYLPQTRWG
jgi:uncharacterized protein YaaR (DUF327 family)